MSDHQPPSKLEIATRILVALAPSIGERLFSKEMQVEHWNRFVEDMKAPTHNPDGSVKTLAESRMAWRLALDLVNLAVDGDREK